MELSHINVTTFNRVHKLMEMRRYKEALDEAMKLIQTDPEYSESYSTIGLIYYRMDEYDKALHWSDEALRRDPENLQAWYVKTLTYYDSENWKKFDAIIEEAIALDPQEAAYYFLLANREQTRGKFTSAKEQMLVALDIAPYEALYLANLSYIEALLGNFEASKSLEVDALKQEAESKYVYLYLSWAADKRGDDYNQLIFLKNAILLDPDNEQIRSEYLEGLQKSYLFYRIVLLPAKLLKKLKPWQILLSWIVAWLLFKPLILVFLILYVLAYWGSKLLVHIKIYGWRFGQRV